MSKILIESAISNKVLVLSEEFRGDIKGGGIASVLQYYRPFFESFKFIPTFKTRDFTDKLVYVGTAELRLYSRLFFDKNIKIVHFHVAADGSFWQNARLIKIAKSSNKKVIMHIHASRFADFYNESNEYLKGKILDNLNLADKIIVLSNSWKSFFLSIGIVEEKLVVLNNITAHPSIPIKKHSSFPLQLLFLGEIGERKGIFELISAISNNKEYFADKIRLIIGGNRNEDQLCDYIEKCNVDDIVDFKGFVSGDLKNTLLSTTDIFCLPSKNEGLPISILEAMSYECAILSSPVGGIPDVIKDNYNGVLVDPYNVESIVDGIKRLLSPDIILQMGERNSKLVKDFYPDSVISKLRNIYIDLLNR